MPILIEVFLKRMAEHPEEADFAASTVLHEADNDVLHSCSDCGLGMIVRQMPRLDNLSLRKRKCSAHTKSAV